MSVRLAERRDIPRLVEMGRAFHAASPYADLEYVESATADWLRNMIHLQSHVIYMSDNGAIGGGVMLDPRLNTTFLIEDFWYSPGGHDGVRLLKTFFKWGRESGAERACMASLPGSPEVCVYYERIGLSPFEIKYSGALV